MLPPTRLIAGDTVLTIGGVEIRALYMGLSHTDTLYAFHLPAERLVIGGTQAISRSLYGSLIPRGMSAEFYGFFSIFNNPGMVIAPAP